MEDYPSVLAGGYERSWEAFVALVADLDGPEGAGPDHGQIERFLDRSGRELLRQLFQDRLDRRAVAEAEAHRVAPRSVVGADGVNRRRVETGRVRGLTSMFGAVTVRRLTYRAPGRVSLRPGEAVLNLPPGSFSAEVRRLLCRYAAAGSFDAALAGVADRCGFGVGKGRAEQIVADAVADWDAFYSAGRPAPLASPGEAVVITCDGKGIVMRPEYRGGAGGRKKMAELACVYTVQPVRRDPSLVLGPGAMPGPAATGKRLFASVTDTVAGVIASAFDDAGARDPGRERPWVVLVDGNRHQIACADDAAAAHGKPVHIVLDVIHVLEYVWEAARVFCSGDEDAAAAWAGERMDAVLHGRVRAVAAGIRRRATRGGYDGPERKTLDRVAGYLTNNEAYMDYPHALANGWPIATGVIEGACRHLVKTVSGMGLLSLFMSCPKQVSAAARVTRPR